MVSGFQVVICVQTNGWTDRQADRHSKFNGTPKECESRKQAHPVI